MREMLKVGADLRLLVSAVTSEVTWTGQSAWAGLRTAWAGPRAGLPTANNLQSYIPQNVSVSVRGRGQAAGREKPVKVRPGARPAPVESGELQPTPHQTLDSWQRDFATTRIKNL